MISYSIISIFAALICVSAISFYNAGTFTMEDLIDPPFARDETYTDSWTRVSSFPMYLTNSTQPDILVLGTTDEGRSYKYFWLYDVFNRFRASTGNHDTNPTSSNPMLTSVRRSRMRNLGSIYQEHNYKWWNYDIVAFQRYSNGYRTTQPAANRLADSNNVYVVALTTGQRQVCGYGCSYYERYCLSLYKGVNVTTGVLGGRSYGFCSHDFHASDLNAVVTAANYYSADGSNEVYVFVSEYPYQTGHSLYYEWRVYRHYVNSFTTGTEITFHSHLYRWRVCYYDTDGDQHCYYKYNWINQMHCLSDFNTKALAIFDQTDAHHKNSLFSVIHCNGHRFKWYPHSDYKLWKGANFGIPASNGRHSAPISFEVYMLQDLLTTYYSSTRIKWTLYVNNNSAGDNSVGCMECL
ncbi:hypothetical protein PCE1_004510 [Barthelona sp. PCE]